MSRRRIDNTSFGKLTATIKGSWEKHENGHQYHQRLSSCLLVAITLVTLITNKQDEAFTMKGKLTIITISLEESSK